MATVERRGKSYRITSSCGYDADGTHQRKVRRTWTPEPGMTDRQIKKELERQKVLMDEECRNGCYVDSNIKFKDFAEKWFEDYAKDHLRTRTYTDYRRISKDVYQAIGGVRLIKLQPHHLIEFYKQLEKPGHNQRTSHWHSDKLKDALAAAQMNHTRLKAKTGIAKGTIVKAVNGENVSRRTAQKISDALGISLKKLFSLTPGSGLSPKSIMFYHAFISSVLERAVKWRVIKENPCRYAEPPRVLHKEIVCMDEKEAAHFLECLENESIENRAMFTLFIYTGMRRGELLGLEWEDIDFNTGVISIRRTSQYTVEKGTYTDTTKTERSKRSIHVPSTVLNLLLAQHKSETVKRLSLGDQWQGSKRVFTSAMGANMSVTVPYHRLKILQRKYDLPNVTLHSLRHTNATLLIEQGVDVRTVSGRLGHSQTSTTMNIYAHQLQSADAAAADALDIALAPKKADKHA